LINDKAFKQLSLLLEAAAAAADAASVTLWSSLFQKLFCGRTRRVDLNFYLGLMLCSKKMKYSSLATCLLLEGSNQKKVTIL
jgi:hypothetical protein